MSLKNHVLATSAWVAVCIAVLILSPASWTSHANPATVRAAHEDTVAETAGTTVEDCTNDITELQDAVAAAWDSTDTWTPGAPTREEIALLCATNEDGWNAAIATTFDYLPACILEDGSGQDVCLWNAELSGNGIGKSVINFDE